MECTLQNERKKSLTKANERGRPALVTADAWVYKGTVYSTKGYNLIGVTTVEGGETRGTTALVYSVIYSSLYRNCTRVIQYTKLVWPSARGVTRSPQQLAFGNRRGNYSSLRNATFGRDKMVKERFLPKRNGKKINFAKMAGENETKPLICEVLMLNQCIV